MVGVTEGREVEPGTGEEPVDEAGSVPHPLKLGLRCAYVGQSEDGMTNSSAWFALVGALGGIV